MPQYTSIVTMLVVLFYFFIATRVPLARRNFGVQLPAITRISSASFAFGAAVLGLVWIVGRAAYYVGYTRAVPGRLPGFFVQSSVCLLLVVGAIVGMAMGFWGK